jgi:hypothetical protein
MKKSIMLLKIVSLLSLSVPAWSFSGEDPAFGHPWHHNELSKAAAAKVGWSGGAASSMAWCTDYLDSYLYNPVWWGQGGFDRYKMSKALAPEMEKLHFDDLFTTPQINLMWRRYTTHTIAALMWAKEKKDVPAAQHIVGVSLHALQDFYSHSNWIDAPDRRDQTYFLYGAPLRQNVGLYSGAYEHSEHLGQKSHGIWRYDAAIYNATGVKEIMEIACTAASPFSNSPECQDFKRAKRGVSLRPTIAGVKLPPGVWWYAPPGIALDNSWVADLAVQQRGLTDITGAKAFSTAYYLAEQQSIQWLQILETAMNRTGGTDFWNDVKATDVSQSQRERQYENYGQMPFQMISAGNYPPRAEQVNKREVYLRVLLHTSDDALAGTDGDIELRADGKKFLLDYAPRTNFITAYNDFERSDRDAYVVGPFDELPKQIEIFNNAPNAGQVVSALYKDFKSAVTSAWYKTGDVVLGLVAGHADQVAQSQKIWEAPQIQNLRSENFVLDLDGGTEGRYQVDGTIRRTGETATELKFQIDLVRERCIKEATSDRLSNSDEPFTLFAVVPLPGGVQSHIAGPYGDVDSGESVDVKRSFEITLPKGYGMLTISAQQWESDDESGATRRKMLESFAGKLDQETQVQRQSFLGALGSSVASDWKLADIEVFAWENAAPTAGILSNTLLSGASPRCGFLLDQHFDKWIKGGQGTSFTLNQGPFKPTGVGVAELQGGAVTGSIADKIFDAPNTPRLPRMDPVGKAETLPPARDRVPVTPLPTTPLPTTPLPRERVFPRPRRLPGG